MNKGNLLLQKEYLGPTGVPALLSYIPDGRRKPLVILAPGGGNQNIDNSKERLSQTLPLEGEDFFKVYVDLPLHGERLAPDLGKRFWTDQVGHFLHPTVVGAARELLQLVDILSQRAEVDPDRVGLAGWSLGGQASLLAAAADRRIKAAIGLCIPYDAWQGPVAPGPDTPAHFIMRTEMDLMSVTHHMCPTAILLIHGAKDAWVTVESSRRLHAALGPFYASCSERLRYIEYPNMAHSISVPEDDACAEEQRQLKQEVAGWLRKFLVP